MKSGLLDEELLLLLLDGLDEVAADARDACVACYQQFIVEEHGFVDVVVCSRIKDYECSAPDNCGSNGAIVIQAIR